MIEALRNLNDRAEIIGLILFILFWALYPVCYVIRNRWRANQKNKAFRAPRPKPKCKPRPLTCLLIFLIIIIGCSTEETPTGPTAGTDGREMAIISLSRGSHLNCAENSMKIYQNRTLVTFLDKGDYDTIVIPHGDSLRAETRSSCSQILWRRDTLVSGDFHWSFNK